MRGIQVKARGVILWDIDGTLMRTKRQGSASPHGGVLKKYGLELRKNANGLSGATDYEVLRQLLGEGEIPKSLMNQIFQELDVESELLDERTLFDLCPGVSRFLQEVQSSVWTNGILTGNTNSRMLSKLEKTNIQNFFNSSLSFTCQFGDERKDIVKRARKYLDEAKYEKTCIVGDTPRDILAGHEFGFPVVAVGTGNYTIDQLAEFSPDLLLTDLEHDSEAFCQFLEAF